MVTDEELRILQRDAARLHTIAPWLTIDVKRDEAGNVSAEATLDAHFTVDPHDLSGSLIREIHRRLDEFDSNLDE